MKVLMLICQGCGANAETGRFCSRCGGALASAKGDELVGTSLGPYRVVSILGEGGMGRVYKGVHPEIGSRVAIKVLSAACAGKPALVERFFAEARAVNLIRHESIVNVLDLSTLPDGRPYIIMEYLDGAPLATVLESGPLPLGSTARMATEVLGALAAAHGKGIVHRDLKPDNIFVSPQGRAKVLDFGIAKLLPEISGAATPTQTGALLGTPHYMAPEQALARTVDHRADLYSLGLILYECVTGRRAFAGESLYELLHHQVHTAPTPPRALRPDLPPEYEAVILRALAKQPEHRYQSAEEFIHQLGAACRNLSGDAWWPIGTSHDAASARIAAMATPSTDPQHRSAERERNPSLVPFAPQPDPLAPTMGGQTAPATQAGAPKRGRWLVAGSLVVALAAGGTTAAVLATSDADPAQPSTAPGDPPTSPDPTPASPVPAPQDSPTPKPGDVGETKATLESPAPTKPNPKPTKPDPTPKNTTTKEKVVAEVEDPEPKPAAPEPVKPRTGLKRIPLGAVDYRNFDVTGYLPKAESAARQLIGDAKFFRLDAEGVMRNGKANLTLQPNFSVTYRFVSPSQGKRPDDLPLGVDYKPNCLIYVSISPDGSEARILEGWKCENERPQPKPGCSSKEVWDYAAAKDVPANAVASMSYYGFRGGTPRWNFSINGTKYSFWVPRTCR